MKFSTQYSLLEDEPQENPKFKVGDIVKSIDPQYPLRSGSEEYSCAVVVQVFPSIVLVSTWTDMRWESTVKPDKLEVMGQASAALLSDCMGRLKH